jgi:hypothetical protein
MDAIEPGNAKAMPEQMSHEKFNSVVCGGGGRNVREHAKKAQQEIKST